ncbi:hypothetical protein ElyMa_003376700 [Elysia marginata]|uniref:Uncharacterized protein n=1 Tax=Elysia marginata TaxID=1093978 RepID=A0AAV4JQT7_9GAST|nr:hypothetical protein ElyMa_003376700 [Elysia marginata]
MDRLDEWHGHRKSEAYRKPALGNCDGVSRYQLYNPPSDSDTLSPVEGKPHQGFYCRHFGIDCVVSQATCQRRLGFRSATMGAVMGSSGQQLPS